MSRNLASIYRVFTSSGQKDFRIIEYSQKEIVQFQSKHMFCIFVHIHIVLCIHISQMCIFFKHHSVISDPLNTKNALAFFFFLSTKRENKNASKQIANL